MIESFFFIIVFFVIENQNFRWINLILFLLSKRDFNAADYKNKFTSIIVLEKKIKVIKV